jgi:hypothetical protein
MRKLMIFLPMLLGACSPYANAECVKSVEQKSTVVEFFGGKKSTTITIKQVCVEYQTVVDHGE